MAAQRPQVDPRNWYKCLNGVVTPWPKFPNLPAVKLTKDRWGNGVASLAIFFFDWLAPQTGLRWIDVGCGNGAFTEVLVERCDPVEVQGVDTSEGQLAFARRRASTAIAVFQQGDAQALPFVDDVFDGATMALAINLIPQPAKAVAEMARVVRPGGWVATYIWDIMGGGFTMEPIRQALDEMGVATPFINAEICRMEGVRSLWENAGLDDVATRRIDIYVTYDDFDDFWDANTGVTDIVNKAIATLSPTKVEILKERLHAILPTDPEGHISYGAYANAVKGRISEFPQLGGKPT